MWDKLKDLINPKSDSTKGQLTKEDLIKLGRNSAIVGVVAGIVYFQTGLDKFDLGAFAAVAMWGIPMLIDFINKYRTDNTK